MSTPSSAVEYLPLWQSLVGSLGAFAVAAFTVWWTNRHTQAREEKQAQRAKNAERRKLLREKLEALVGGADYAYASNLAVAHHAMAVLEASWLKRGAPKQAEDVRSSAGLDQFTAIIMSQLYFPSLIKPVNDLGNALREAASHVVAQLKAGSEVGSSFGLPDLKPIFAEAKDLRMVVMAEARRLLESDFDLKD